MITINDRDRIEWRDGMTVTDILNAMGFTYALITVTVDGELVPKEDYETYSVPDDAKVTVFHLAHGG